MKLKDKMRNIFSVFLSISILLFFSCAGTPDTQEDDDTEQSVELLDETQNTEAEIENEAEPDSIEIDEPELEDDQAEPQPSLQDEVSSLDDFIEEEEQNYIEEQIVDTEEITEEISDDIETAEVIEQIEDEPVPVETPTVVETAPPPVPAPPVVQPQPPPVQTPSPAPVVQTPAPVQTPPISPPALLGPAEENPPSQRETVLPRVEPRVETPAPVAASETPILPLVTPQNNDIVFSRIVRATVGQIIEIPFTGTGWIYMGELASRRGVVYNSTRRDPEGQSIIFGAEEAGTYVLRFFKEDFLSGYIINDYVQVIVGEAPSIGGTGWFAPPYDRGRVVALPRWPSALDAGQREPSLTPSNPPVDNEPGGSSAAANVTVESPSSQGTPPSQGAVPSQGTTPSQGPAAAVETASGAAVERQEVIDPDLILRRARETFANGNVAPALALLDQLKEYYPNGSDELYWLYGQFYEANSPSRNILLSLDYYRRLVNEYPQSSRYNDARSRIAYLERFYINIQ